MTIKNFNYFKSLTTQNVLIVSLALTLFLSSFGLFADPNYFCLVFYSFARK